MYDKWRMTYPHNGSFRTRNKDFLPLKSPGQGSSNTRSGRILFRKKSPSATKRGSNIQKMALIKTRSNQISGIQYITVASKKATP